MHRQLISSSEERPSAAEPPRAAGIETTLRQPPARQQLTKPSRLRIRRTGVAISLAIAVLTASCEASRPPVSPGPKATNAAAAALLPKHVLELPSVDFHTYERLLYQLRGTPVVVNIWASWCGPCTKEAPMLSGAAKQYGNDIQFLGVDIQDDRNSAAAYSIEYHVPYPSLFDESGAIHDALGFVGLPDTVFYAADGSIIDTWSGPLTRADLEMNIDRLLSNG